MFLICGIRSWNIMICQALTKPSIELAQIFLTMWCVSWTLAATRLCKAYLSLIVGSSERDVLFCERKNMKWSIISRCFLVSREVILFLSSLDIKVFINRCGVVDQMTGKGRKLFVFGKQECKIIHMLWNVHLLSNHWYISFILFYCKNPF